MYRKHLLHWELGTRRNFLRQGICMDGRFLEEQYEAKIFGGDFVD